MNRVSNEAIVSRRQPDRVERAESPLQQPRRPRLVERRAVPQPLARDHLGVKELRQVRARHLPGRDEDGVAPGVEEADEVHALVGRCEGDDGQVDEERPAEPGLEPVPEPSVQLRNQARRRGAVLREGRLVILHERFPKARDRVRDAQEHRSPAVGSGAGPFGGPAAPVAGGEREHERRAEDRGAATGDRSWFHVPLLQDDNAVTART